MKKREIILSKLFAEIGDNCYIEPPLDANWGQHTHLGDNVYANFNLTLVDDTHIYTGNYVMIGPNVTIPLPWNDGKKPRSLIFQSILVIMSG